MKTPRNWDQLLECDLAQRAKGRMATPALTYHNWEHVECLVWHAKHTFEYPFDLALGKAVIAHDVIYDTLPQKEWRSAEWLLDNDGHGASTIEAVRHIMKTDGHRVTDDNRMVLLDLANFMFPRSTQKDFIKIMMESANIYKAPPTEIIEKSMEFMEDLRSRFSDTELMDLPVAERLAFVGIRTGMERTILMYEESLKGAKRA